MNHIKKSFVLPTGRMYLLGMAFILLLLPARVYSVPRVCFENGLGGITGKITGDLKPLARVRIALLLHDKVIDVTETDDDGFFKFRYVEEGYYDVKALKDDYVTNTVTTIPVSADHVTKIDFYMPRVNNSHMPDDPITETWEYYHRKMTHPDRSWPR